MISSGPGSCLVCTDRHPCLHDWSRELSAKSPFLGLAASDYTQLLGDLSLAARTTVAMAHAEITMPASGSLAPGDNHLRQLPLFLEDSIPGKTILGKLSKTLR